MAHQNLLDRSRGSCHFSCCTHYGQTSVDDSMHTQKESAIVLNAGFGVDVIPIGS